MKNSTILFLLFFCTTCTTYDNAIIYHKYFVSGTHPLLRFYGFSSDTTSDRSLVKKYKPVFFYKNGSSFSSERYLIDTEIAAGASTNSLYGSWGNYLINADTIQLEKFQLNASNYERIILKGIISKDQIHWTSRKEHNETFKPVDYSIYFKSFSARPDSSKNFTRIKKKYNQ